MLHRLLLDRVVQLGQLRRHSHAMQPQVPINLAEAFLVLRVGKVFPDSLLEVISYDRLVLELVQVVLEERTKDL